MRALAKDPRQRQQSMEELFDELQRCYGSVRYRRSLDVRSAAEAPIPLQRVKRPGSGPFSEPIARVTPPGVPHRGIGLGNGPILLTRRKERRKTLPMEPGRRRRRRRPRPRTRPLPTRRADAGRAKSPTGSRWTSTRPTAPAGKHEVVAHRACGAERLARDALLVGDAAGRRGDLAALLFLGTVGIGLARDRRGHPAARDHDRGQAHDQRRRSRR